MAAEVPPTLTKQGFWTTFELRHGEFDLSSSEIFQRRYLEHQERQREKRARALDPVEDSEDSVEPMDIP